MFPYAVQVRTLLEEHFTLFYDILKDHSMTAIKELTAQAKDSEDPVAYLQQKKGTLYVHVIVVQQTILSELGRLKANSQGRLIQNIPLNSSGLTTTSHELHEFPALYLE